MHKSIIAIKLAPGAKGFPRIHRLTTLKDGTIRAVSLPDLPVDGKANHALIKYLSTLLNIPQSRISIIHGQTARRKTLQIESELMNQELIFEKLDTMCR